MCLCDDDSSDDNKGNAAQSTLSASASAEHNQEQVDTLDAFMSRLEQDQAHNNGAQGERLDLSDDVYSDDASSSDAAVSACRKRLLGENEAKGRGSKVAKPDIEQPEHSNRISGHSNAAVNVRKQLWTPPVSTEQGQAWRDLHGVTCQILGHHAAKLSRNESTEPPLSCDDSIADPVFTFRELTNRNLVPVSVLESMRRQVVSSVESESDNIVPTLVQSQVIPCALLGHNLLVTAATGQGKTWAYVLPLIAHVLANKEPAWLQDPSAAKMPVALVLVPTRELAQQIASQVQTLTSSFLQTVAIIGGHGKYQLQLQVQKMASVDVVIATPGRLLDVIEQRRPAKHLLSLVRTSFVVLDEADKMLDMGSFYEQVQQILSQCHADKQTLLLSATMSRKVEALAQRYLSRAVRIAVGRVGQPSEFVTQHAVVLPHRDAKDGWLQTMLPSWIATGSRTLIFCATRDECERLAALLLDQRRAVGVVDRSAVTTLHGDKHQSDRNAALRAFVVGMVAVLIATDVAARGLDVPQVATVVNHDAPKNLNVYTHRIGRAGRLGGDQVHVGTAYTLLTSRDARFAASLVTVWERDGHEISDELRRLVRQQAQR